MKWRNAARDPLPETSRSVLISERGVYHIAYFDKETRVFVLSEGSSKTVLPEDHVYWTDIDVLPRSRKKIVLVIDDDEDDRNLMIQGMVRCRADLKVDAVNDGAEALDYLLHKGKYGHLSTSPDVILLDLNLPMVDGFEVMERIRKEEALRQIPIFVISTSRSVDQWDKALNLGARCFFNKGSSAADINKVVGEICSNIN
jgi:CheY-like chemotaxis protein